MFEKFILYLAIVVSLGSGFSVHASDLEWERFGEWEVRATHGDMDPYTNVIIRTRFNRNEESQDSRLYRGAEGLVFGFKIFNGRTMDIYTMIDFGGDNHWPRCDFNLASFRVDGSRPYYISTIEVPGGCNGVAMNGRTVSMFKRGGSAKLKVGYRTGYISLIGFSSAYAKALQLSRR